MRKLALLVLLLQLSSCSQWCDCQNSKADSNQDAAHSHEQSLSEQMQQEQQSIASTSVASDGTVIEDRQMAEAPPVQSAPTVSQLDQLMAEPGAKPIWPVVQKTRLQRKSLPSEQYAAFQQGAFQQGTMSHMAAMSVYPDLPQSRKQLTDYAAQMAFKLAGFDELKGAKVGVTSFVEFDDNLQQTTALGNQFAEAMVTLLPQYGVEVIEYKLTRDIDVSPRGDIALSRDVRELQKEVGMDYVMTGTLVATRRGIQINSRIVSVQGHKVIAAASTLVPHLVLQQIQP
jgi:TolB-like protein